MASNIVTWTVGGKDYRLKLSGEAICNVERKYLGGRNIMHAMGNLEAIASAKDGDALPIPSLNLMLGVIHESAVRLNHGIGLKDVIRLYDVYADEEDGDVASLYSDVYLPLFGAAGFFKRADPEKTDPETESQETEAEE